MHNRFTSSSPQEIACHVTCALAALLRSVRMGVGILASCIQQVPLCFRRLAWVAARKDEAAGEEVLVHWASTGTGHTEQAWPCLVTMLVQAWLLTVLQSSCSFLIVPASQAPGWLQ